jgi:hypothetical protein
LWFVSPSSPKSGNGNDKCPRLKNGYSDNILLLERARELEWKFDG